MPVPYVPMSPGVPMSPSRHGDRGDSRDRGDGGDSRDSNKRGDFSFHIEYPPPSARLTCPASAMRCRHFFALS